MKIFFPTHAELEMLVWEKIKRIGGHTWTETCSFTDLACWCTFGCDSHKVEFSWCQSCPKWVGVIQIQCYGNEAVWILPRIWPVPQHLRGEIFLPGYYCAVPHSKQMLKLNQDLLSWVDAIWHCTHAAMMSSFLPLSCKIFQSETWNSWASHFSRISSFTTHPFGEGMKARSLPPPQNILNFHLSSLGITCLTGAGVQAVLICPFAKTLSKQSASYLLCEEEKKKMTLLR